MTLDWDERLTPSRISGEWAVYLAERLRRRGTGRGGTLAWAKRYLPRHFSAPPAAMHRDVAAALDAMRRSRSGRLNVLGPRGSAKSTLVSLAYVLRCAAERSEPYVWIASDAREQAAAHVDGVRYELEESAALRGAYGLKPRAGGAWRRGVLELNNGVRIEAIGTGQRVRGRRHGAHRPSLIVCDDLQNDLHGASGAARRRTEEWFFGTLLNAGAPGTHVIHLGTAFHPADLGRRLRDAPGWKTLEYRALVREPERRDLWEAWERLARDGEKGYAKAREMLAAQQAAMEAGGESYWPARFGTSDLMRMRLEMGRAAFEREMQCRPLRSDEREFSDSYFGESIWFDEAPATGLRVAAIDPSLGRSGSAGDFSATAMATTTGDGTWYVDAEIERWTTEELLTSTVETLRAFRATACGVESNAFQAVLCDELRRRLAEAGLGGTTLWEVENRTAKGLRIRRLGPLLSRGRLKFRRGSRGAKRLVEQLREFPNGEHDDGPDALEMAVRLGEELLQNSRGSDGLGRRLVGGRRPGAGS